MIANRFDSEPSVTLLLVGLGAVSGLMPDLDIDGKLRNKITLSHKVIQAAAQLIGILLIIYSFYEENNMEDRKSTRLNSSHMSISYAVFCLKKKKNNTSNSTICEL